MSCCILCSEGVPEPSRLMTRRPGGAAPGIGGQAGPLGETARWAESGSGTWNGPRRSLRSPSSSCAESVARLSWGVWALASASGERPDQVPIPWGGLRPADTENGSGGDVSAHCA